jgi:C-terminal processing protease CtpA/Prc
MRIAAGPLWLPLGFGSLALSASLLWATPAPTLVPASASPTQQLSATHPDTAPASRISSGDLADLDNDQYAIRQQASQRLLADNSLTLDAIAQGYAAATTLEQKHRLMDVAHHHLIRMIRDEVFAGEALGSIGISIGRVPIDAEPGVEGPAIRVQATLPGFPAYAVLQSGDLITAVNGHAPATQVGMGRPDNQFQQLIQAAAQTGKPIRLSVVSDGKKREVTVAAAGLVSLNAFYNSTTGALAAPVRREWERFQTYLELERKADSSFQPDYSKLKESLLHPEPTEQDFPGMLP